MNFCKAVSCRLGETLGCALCSDKGKYFCIGPTLRSLHDQNIIPVHGQYGCIFLNYDGELYARWSLDIKAVSAAIKYRDRELVQWE